MGETGLNTELFFILRGTGRWGDKQVNQVVRSNVRQIYGYFPSLDLSPNITGSRQTAYRQEIFSS